jgi:hypothetical protein
MTEQNDDKYIFVCIRIPMKLFQDGKYELRNDLANIEFEDCSELPGKGNLDECNLNSVFNNFYINTNTLSNITNTNNNYIQKNDKPEDISSIYVLKSELLNKPYKKYKNNTFKRTIKDTLKRFSRKIRE